MRKVFIVSDKSAASARRYFRRWYPWVSVVARATSGFWGFESRYDYRLWRKQK